MGAALTDNFTEVSVAGTETTLAAPGKAYGASTLNLTNPSGWQTITGQIFAMRRVDSSGNYVPGSYTEWIGVLAGSAMTINPVPLYGTDPAGGYAADGLTQVFVPLSSIAWNRMMAAILNQHTQAGAHVGLTNSGGANFTGGLTTDSLTITGQNVSAGWNALGQTLTYASNNGNKEFTCTASADLRNTLSVGMKQQLTRNTVPPTQCMSFQSASSQYATKASPTGITFTSAFTCEAWVYLNSYHLGYVVSREDGSNGWGLYIDGNGLIKCEYKSGGSATEIDSYQSLPLKRWVHIAAVITSVSSKTGAIYLNGTSVPTTFGASGTTTLSQGTGPLQVGAGNGSSYFDGYISEARVWSVAQTQTQIQNNMAINCIGTESNLVALFEGNGNFNDLTSNANNLTATGGAVATQASNPYNATEYAVVTKVSYSNPTTTVTLFTGTDNNIPNQTLNSPQYSTQRAPYGFPAGRDKWMADTLIRVRNGVSTSANTWVNPGSYQLAVPTGAWDLGYSSYIVATAASQTYLGAVATLSTTNNGESDTELTSQAPANSNASTEQDGWVAKEKPLTISALTTYYLNLIIGASSPTLYTGTNSTASNGTPVAVIRARCAYI